jgi:hypothetical protein
MCSYPTPELDDEVEAKIDHETFSAVVPQDGSARASYGTVPRGEIGHITYATCAGWFTVLWAGRSASVRYERPELGRLLFVTKPRRGRKQVPFDVAPYKGRF